MEATKNHKPSSRSKTHAQPNQQWQQLTFCQNQIFCYFDKIPRILITCIIILCTSSSCKKFLDKKSDSSLTVPSTIRDLQALLDDNDIMNLSTPSFGESSSDDYFLTADMYNAFSLLEHNTYRWIPQEYNFVNDWSMSYSAIYNANLCLERIEKVDRNPSYSNQWDNVKGSARFFRAFHFLNLAWVFSKAYDESTYESDLGIVLKLQTDFNIPSKRASVKDTYQQIVSDARDASLLLPDAPAHVMRPSKAAAFGLLARSFLSMRKYDSAYKYANLCLSLKNTLLDYNDVDLSSYAPFKRFNIETIFYTTMNPNNFLHFPGIGNIDTVLSSLYSEADLRKKGFFDSNGIYYVYKGNYTEDPYTFFSGIATDEIYLIRAECQARLGNKIPALEDLNKLLKNRWDKAIQFIPVDASTPEEAVDKIQIERRKELLMRGLRWGDVKRLNKEGANIVLKRLVGNEIYTLQPNDNRYALPLPADIIKAAQIPQN